MVWCNIVTRNVRRYGASLHMFGKIGAWCAKDWPPRALDHNFWTQNPSRSSKLSKDSDCSLVSNKNFSEILPSNGLGPWPCEVGQGSLKALHLWRHSQKIHTPQPKNFFRVHTRRLATSFWAFEQFSTTFGAWVTHVQSHMRSGCFGVRIPESYQMSKC